MIALFEKQLHGGPQHGFALLVARAAAAFERHPGRGIGRGGLCVHIDFRVSRIDSVVRSPYITHG